MIRPLALFEKSLYNLIESFLSEVRALFQYGRNIDIRYFKRLTEIGERLESKNYEHMEAQTGRMTRESDCLLTLVKTFIEIFAISFFFFSRNLKLNTIFF